MLEESHASAVRVVGEAASVRSAAELVRTCDADVVFLDVQLAGESGLELLPLLDPSVAVVFVTAFDQYAVQAFAQGALDYLVKPVEPARLAETVQRLQERLRASTPALDPGALLQQLARLLQPPVDPAASSQSLRWVRASVGPTVRLIAVEDIDFLRADEKYTQVAWRDEGGQAREAIIRTALKDLIPQLDASQFAQVHRSVVVNLRAISHVTRGSNETADIHLKGRAEVLPVSRTYLHLFRQM